MASLHHSLIALTAPPGTVFIFADRGVISAFLFVALACLWLIVEPAASAVGKRLAQIIMNGHQS
jgi:ABC-type sulfate transport system permease component